MKKYIGYRPSANSAKLFVLRTQIGYGLSANSAKPTVVINSAEIPETAQGI
jgi:hypothetical protein